MKIVIENLLKIWPKTDSPKAILFLNEIEEIFNIMEPEEFQETMIPLMSKLAVCVSSLNHLIAIAALDMLQTGNIMFFLDVIRENSEIVLPIMLPGLCENKEKPHWNVMIREKTNDALDRFMDMNQKLFDEISKEHKNVVVEEDFKMPVEKIEEEIR